MKELKLGNKSCVNLERIMCYPQYLFPNSVATIVTYVVQLNSRGKSDLSKPIMIIPSLLAMT